MLYRTRESRLDIAAQPSMTVLSVLLTVLSGVQVMIRFWVNHHLLDLVDRPLWYPYTLHPSTLNP